MMEAIRILNGLGFTVIQADLEQGQLWIQIPPVRH